MSIAEEIEKLQALHDQGALSEDEFNQAKVTLLARLADEQSVSYTSDLNKEAEHLRLQNELNQLDLDWEHERESYKVRGRNGARYIPSVPISIIAMIAGIVFGVVWISLTVSQGELGLPTFFGLLVIFVVVGRSVYDYNKARGYRQAQGRYQERRQQLLSRRSSGNREW